MTRLQMGAVTVCLLEIIYLHSTCPRDRFGRLHSVALRGVTMFVTMLKNTCKWLMNWCSGGLFVNLYKALKKHCHHAISS